MAGFLKFIALVVLTVLAFLTLGWFSFSHISSLRYLNPGRTALMVERAGPVDQTWVPLSKISGSLRQAVIVAEDGDFYRHQGIDFYEMRESLKKNLRKKAFARGFSTITMQTAKNLYLSHQKTVTRKILEILIALKMEQVLSKDRILEIYLNVVEWGKGIYGAEAAARHYFKKPALRLTADEAAFLAAILPNPRKWGRWPPGPYVHRRKQAILIRMGTRMGIRPAPPKVEIELPELPEDLPGEPVEEVPSGSETAPETLPETMPIPETAPSEPPGNSFPETDEGLPSP